VWVLASFAVALEFVTRVIPTRLLIAQSKIGFTSLRVALSLATRS
jgi:hypothetical protein